MKKNFYYLYWDVPNGDLELYSEGKSASTLSAEHSKETNDWNTETPTREVFKIEAIKSLCDPF